MRSTTGYRRTTRFAALPFEGAAEELPPADIAWDAHLYMAPQYYSWTCSACSLDWVLEATWTRPSDRYLTTMEIGYTENINSTYGLMNGDGRELQRVLGNYGLASDQAWLDFDMVYELAQHTTGMMSGGNWYHWVGLRGTSGSNLWIANSAPGYKGVWDILSREDFLRLGSFSVVWLV
jgi:hypothetical protein